MLKLVMLLVLQVYCPNGNCPVQYQPTYTYQPYTYRFRQVPRTNSHWTFSPERTISDHLRNTHKVSSSGMTTEQMLSLHDALHEGRASIKQAPPRKTTVTAIRQVDGPPL